MDTKSRTWMPRLSTAGSEIIRAAELERRAAVSYSYPTLDTPEQIADMAAQAEQLVLMRRWRVRFANWFCRRQEFTPFERRRWFRLDEIADEYAREARSLSINESKRQEICDALRRAILEGKFVDGKGRSRVLNLHPSWRKFRTRCSDGARSGVRETYRVFVDRAQRLRGMVQKARTGDSDLAACP